MRSMRDLTVAAHLRRETNVVLETLLFASNRAPPCDEVPNPVVPGAASGAAAG